MAKSRVRLEGKGENSKITDTYDVERKEMSNEQINSSLEDVGVAAAKRAGSKGAMPVGNTVRAKAIKNIIAEIISDMGGLENMSYQQFEMSRRFASLAVIAQSFDQDIALGNIEQKDLDNLVIITRTLSQLSKNLNNGERKAKDIGGNDLQSYLKEINKKSKKAKKEADEIEDTDYE